MTETELSSLIQEAYALKTKIDADKAQLKDINDRILDHTRQMIPPTKTTCTIPADSGLSAKITKKDSYKWDQNVLETARTTMGDERFMTIFKYAWEPHDKRTIDQFLAHAPVGERELINQALTITTTYSVTYNRKVKESV